jgi:two-component system sensor histidine kinase HydH
VFSDAGSVTLVEIQANRFDIVSRLADDLAHEIKNPLHAMVINLELVKRRVQAGDVASALQRAEIVGVEVVRVNAIIDQLLQLLRPARQADPVVDLDRAVDELLPLLTQQARLSGVELVYQGIDSPVAAPIRKDALKLVLLNLVAGALEHLRAHGGRIEISASCSDDGVSLVVLGHGAAPTEVPARRSPPAPLDDEARERGRAVVRHLVEGAGGALSDGADEADVASCTVRFPRRMRA